MHACLPTCSASVAGMLSPLYTLNSTHCDVYTVLNFGGEREQFAIQKFKAIFWINLEILKFLKIKSLKMVQILLLQLFTSLLLYEVMDT